MQKKTLLHLNQIAELVVSLGLQVLMWGGVSLGRTGHYAHLLKWYLEISHEGNDWVELKTGLADRWRKPLWWQQRKNSRELMSEKSSL